MPSATAYQEPWKKGETDFAKFAYLVWRQLKKPRKVKELILQMSVNDRYGVPSESTIKKWRSAYDWKERTDNFDAYMGLEVDSEPEPVYLMAVRKHETQFGDIAASGSNNIVDLFNDFGEKLVRAASMLDIPDPSEEDAKVSIGDFKKLAETFNILARTAKELHEIGLEAEGIRALMEELDLNG